MASTFIVLLYDAALVLPPLAVAIGFLLLLVPRRERRNVVLHTRRAA